MLGFVAWNTKRLAVAYIKHQFRIICKCFYMMGVQCSTVATSAAFVIISLINRLAPLCQFATSLSAITDKRLTALPVWGFIPNEVFCSPSKTTNTRAVPGLLVSTIESLAAIQALAGLRWVANRPTSPRAIMSRSRTIGFYIELLTAFLTCIRDLCVFHALHYNMFSPAYVAVALERMAQAFPGIHIERVK
jgi:hypothetical protein